MPVNVGTLDQYIRIVLGLALIAYAFQDGLAIQGWHWAGLVGVVPLVTAFFKSCPLIAPWGSQAAPSASRSAGSREPGESATNIIAWRIGQVLLGSSGSHRRRLGRLA